MDNLPCPMCNFTGTRAILENHVKKAHLKWFPYECAYCEHMDVSHAEQETHRQAKHPDQQAKVIYCGNDLIEKQLVEMMNAAEKKAMGESDMGVTSLVDASRAGVSPTSNIPTPALHTILKPEAITPQPSTQRSTRKRKAKAIKAVRTVHNPSPPIGEPSEYNGNGSPAPAYVNGCTSEKRIPNADSIVNAIATDEMIPFNGSHSHILPPLNKKPQPTPDTCRFCFYVFPTIVSNKFELMEDKLEHMQVHMEAEFKGVVPMLDSHDRLNRLGALCFDGFDLDSPVQEGPVDIKPIIHNGIVKGSCDISNNISSFNTSLYEEEGAGSYPSSLGGFEREASDSMSESMETSAMDDLCDSKDIKRNMDCEWAPTHGGRRLKMTECRICSESFNTAKMSHHVWQHHFHTKIYQCASCSYSTAQGRSNVYMHWKKHHKGQPQINDRRNEFIKEYKTIYEQCYGTLPRNQNGVIRVRQMKRDSAGAANSKSNFCYACNNNVIQNAYAHVWMKHVGEKGFVCELCDYKAFARDQAVDHWLRNHDGEARINDVRDNFREEFRNAWTACFPDKHVA